MTEEEISNMLDCQHQLIARVVLAGWTFERTEAVRRVGANYHDGKFDPGYKVSDIRVRAVSPRGPDTSWCTSWCDDEYGAACEAFGMMEDKAPQDTSLDDLFKVEDR